MITEATRCCEGCGCILPDPPAAAVCPRCSRVAIPLHTEWPKGLKKWLFAEMIKQFWAPHHQATEQFRWEFLLRSVVAGRTWGRQIVPYAVNATDCFAVACRQFTEATAEPAPITRSTTNAA